MRYVALYIAVYFSTYIAFVEPRYDYFGLGLRPGLGAMQVVLLAGIALMPAVLLPARFKRPSDFLLCVQYLLVYVPAVWVAFNASRPALETNQAWALVVVLFVAMTIQIATARVLPVVPLRNSRIHPWMFGGALIFFIGFGFSTLAILVGGNFELVSLDLIYDLRRSTAAALEQSGSALGGYLFNWLSSAALPLCMAIGLFCKRSWLVLCSLAGFVFLYGIWGSKATLLTPFALYAIFQLMQRPPQRQQLSALITALCVLLAVPLAMLAFSAEVQEFFVGWYVAIVHQRTFSSSALAIPQYLDFFSSNPLTFGSHIRGVNLLVDYPYDLDIPRSVGYFTYGAPTAGFPITLNANYWAQDGIAAFGIAGILPVAVLAGFVYWALDCAAARLDVRFATVCVGFIAMNLVDTSLFTTLVTGGLALMMLVFAIFPRRLLGYDTRTFARIRTR